MIHVRGSSSSPQSAVEAEARNTLFAATAAAPTEHHHPKDLPYTYLHARPKELELPHSPPAVGAMREERGSQRPHRWRWMEGN
jgi:hypothetical protein